MILIVDVWHQYSGILKKRKEPREISNVRITDDDLKVLVGDITNVSDLDIYSVTIKVIIKDKKGNILHTRYSTLSDSRYISSTGPVIQKMPNKFSFMLGFNDYSDLDFHAEVVDLGYEKKGFADILNTPLN